MRRRFPLLLALGLALCVASAGVASTTATFTNGPLVARKMEAHYNGAAYKRRLAKAGGKVTRRILCGYDGFEVDCTGALRVKGVALKAEWELRKLGRARAKLSWTFTGKGVFDADHEIVAPKDFGLTTF